MTNKSKEEIIPDHRALGRVFRDAAAIAIEDRKLGRSQATRAFIILRKGAAL